MTKRSNSTHLFLIYACVLVYLLSPFSMASEIKEVQESVISGQRQNTKIQHEIDLLYKEEDQLDRQYRKFLLTLKTTKSNNQGLEKQLQQQALKKTSLETQLLSVAGVDTEIEPIMREMQRSLKNFIVADFPFLLDHRMRAVAQLEEDLANVELDLSTKYQKTLQAFKEEGEYGLSMDTYQGSLQLDGATREVNYLRLGRVALYYQKLDGTQAAKWSLNTQAWMPLTTAENKAVSKAIQMANGTAISQLLELPLEAPALKTLSQAAAKKGIGND
ncbi:MAG: hypothetical protein ACI9ES_001023 [Oceanospirillaceae bacterium]|jgi:hypothetical protein